MNLTKNILKYLSDFSIEYCKKRNIELRENFYSLVMMIDYYRDMSSWGVYISSPYINYRLDLVNEELYVFLKERLTKDEIEYIRSFIFFNKDARFVKYLNSYYPTDDRPIHVKNIETDGAEIDSAIVILSQNLENIHA